ncbi:hypothetical protein SAMN04488058_10344 [Deinococcus reticulitermitis]|uniref:Uncharacterized protein n=1 Tax=Deinococcus reticulitermitis TaxID=856736 RepID=A0A1H6V4L2_9DEIO|nr:hypothetical protein [Deinococcus reticulitermitis]SEI99471.1 hypothetical protein SAMN04488058_10344 [Deinococcus reticulitermitis]
MEDILVPLGFFAMVFGFPLLRRQMIHRHQLERLGAEQANAPAPAPPPGPDEAASLALKLPEPHRLYALALLCRIEDARPEELDAHSRHVLTQARHHELPATLRAYLGLTPASRQRLAERGQDAEALLREQLELISRGVAGALGRDAAAADGLLTQGHYLREKFTPIELGEPVRLDRSP